jgi:methylthioribose-1-phosphate isomerase
MPGTSGNLSVALPGEPKRIVITASGLSKGELSDADVVTVDVDTVRPVSPGTLRPSAETAIHAALYATVDCQAVLHVHSPCATAIASIARPGTGVRMHHFEHYELIKGLGMADPSRLALPIFPNWPDVPKIAADIAAYLDESRPAAGAAPVPPALLLSHHGVTVWGSTYAEARDRLECVESLCQLALIVGDAHTSILIHREEQP